MKPLSSYHPLLYWLRVRQKRLARSLAWRFSGRRYARPVADSPRLPYRYIKHTSKLIRTLGDCDLALQHNKVINLRLAVACIDGVRIGPGEYFSFCQLVGRPSRARGFVEGMELSFGEARSGIGGGICQLSNLIHWMAIHSPLQVVERANHSFDPFPDEGRVLPFGSGAAIFYNYIDLVLHNPGPHAFQLKLHVGAHQLEGELLCEQPRGYRYHVYQQGHRFVREGGRVFRENQIWRDIRTKGQDCELVRQECLYRNRVVVKYPVADDLLEQA
ncbi:MULTISPECIES: VanW family protein [Pseudomonas]|uniref:VanW family protein n=1 Tax=Pseudomonas piscis TaxID=2614538 RepID=A0ABY9NN66_9PSED|nr:MULTISPECIES: VanW family protein [Pseudomonas]POA51792.1 vancomycin resistance protein [Pseudomonas sp. FW507-12TSA]WMN20018.1 VanW family protein [Pseudomonas piscis]